MFVYKSYKLSCQCSLMSRGSITWIMDVKTRLNYDHIESWYMSKNKSSLFCTLGVLLSSWLRLPHIMSVDHDHGFSALFRVKIGQSAVKRKAYICKLSFSTQRWRFSYGRTKIRWITRVGRKAKLESQLQMSNKGSIRQVYIPFSISNESSWTSAFN